MAIIFQRAVSERNASGNPGATPAPAGTHILGLDVTGTTYTWVLDGLTVSGAAALADDNKYATLTTSAGAFVIPTRDLQAVSQASANGTPFPSSAIGALLLANFANLSTFLSSPARSAST